MYRTVASAGARLNADQAVLDGEIVAIDDAGRPSFQALQHRGSAPKHRIVFYAFDLLQLNGRSLLSEPLVNRRDSLIKVIGESGVLLSQELPGTPSQIVQAVRALGLEGVIAKRKSSPYEPGGRSGSWLKLKLEQSQEFVIGGYRPADKAVDALLVGYYEDRNLRFAAKVRAGFVPASRRDLFLQLQSLKRALCPFGDLPTSPSASRWGGGVGADEMKEMTWVEPRLVAQIRFAEWTVEGRLRHAKFLGLRQDKKARSVHRE